MVLKLLTQLVMNRIVGLVVLIGLVGAGCVASSDDERLGPDWAGGKADSAQYLAYNRITSEEQFRGMALTNGGVVIQGASLKFLIDRRKPSQPVVYFQNANYTEHGATPDAARYHFYFAEAVLNNFVDDLTSFNDHTYSVQDKRYVAGTVQMYKLDPDGPPLYGFQLYPEDVAAERTILDVVTTVKAAFQIPRAKLAYVATGPQQTTTTIANNLAGLGVQNTTVDQLLGALKFLPLNLGEAWGYLRIFPASSDNLTALDIAVLDELPLDLAVVSGVITKAYQDQSSHVSLKSKERGTPDMVLRDAGPDHAKLAPFADQPVHLVVKADGWKLERSDDATVLAKFHERTDKPWVPVTYTVEHQVSSFAEMCPTSPGDCLAQAAKFGSKAANLGFLQHRAVLGRATDTGSPSARAGYNLSPPGDGVPIQYYFDFIAYGPNATLRAKLQALITAEKAGTLSSAQRKAMADDVRAELYRAQMPPALLAAVRAKVTATLPGVDKIKVRSSANAEDLKNFDGAGLHDSFSAKLSAADRADGSCQVVESNDGVVTKLDMSPKTLNCGLKGVWASLWNKRAIEERSFARLDHATVGMGIAVVEKYDDDADIAANAVIVTRVIGNEGLYGYNFSTQVGNDLVTNPTPGTYAENVIAGFVDETAAPTFTVLRYATPIANSPALSHRVLPDAQMTAMLGFARAIESAYCDAKPSYHPNGCDYVTLDPAKPTALDMELKILDTGHYVFKQVREFAGH